MNGSNVAKYMYGSNAAYLYEWLERGLSERLDAACVDGLPAAY